MRRTATVALFVLAWLVGPVVYIHDGPAPPPVPAPSPSMTISR